jgi:uncharacterized protein YcfL
MKKFLLLIPITFLLICCKKEDDTFIAKYQSVIGPWNTQSITYDSSGITITKSTRYDRLIINDDLTYNIQYDSTNTIENGTIKIISQNNDKLEIYFAAVYPMTSSFAGSHLFANSIITLTSLTNDEMILKSNDPGYYDYPEFHFKRNYFFIID